MARALQKRLRTATGATLVPAMLASTVAGAQGAVVQTAEFIFTSAPFASAHASTIVETPSGLVVAWFGGTREGASDVGIWLSRRDGSRWSAPIEVATGVQDDGRRLPCWNPVLFRMGSELQLYYKVGPSPRDWWGMLLTSRDDGRSWRPATRLPDGILGPIKNKPIALDDGSILSPSSTEAALDAPAPQWRVHIERWRGTWRSASPTEQAGAAVVDAIQPTLLTFGDGRVEALVRTRSHRIYMSWSSDRGESWSALAPTELPNPNAGIDAVTLRDGRQLLVYNHSATERTPLTVATSADGVHWTVVATLERDPGEYSYPAVIQSADGLVHVTYTWQRARIRHVVLDLRHPPSPQR